MKQLKRWAAMNKLYLFIIVVIIFFGYIDTVQIRPFHVMQTPEAWQLYNDFSGPAWIMMWTLVLISIGFIYYILMKDKSEAVALSSAGIIMFLTGLEDVFFFVFLGESPTQCMAWFNDVGHINSYVSTYLLGETCVSPTAMYLTAGIGLVVAYVVYKKLQVAKW